MRRDDVLDILNRIPEVDHPKVMFVMRTGPMICLDILFRTEPHYLVVRGREAGNQDEGRAFFVPYEDIGSLKIERVVKLAELEAMYGDRPAPARKADSTAAAITVSASTDTPPPTPAVALDPAEIARQNLLDRIRAARTQTTAAKAGK